MTASPTTDIALRRASSEELAECGFRIEEVPQPDGTTRYVYIPLTEEEFLHPKEDYRLPNSTFHDEVNSDARDMLLRRYADDPSVAVFRDLIIEWDVALDDHCPDVCVVFNVKNRELNRTRFKVAEEGTRPSLMIETVSPRYRKTDREKKVIEYAMAGVQEYVIVDRRKQRGQMLDEVLGYRLVGGHYQPIAPDEEGWIEARTVGVRMSLRDGRLAMEDIATSERLLTSRELEARARELEVRARAEQAAREAAEAELAALRAQLNALQSTKPRKNKKKS